MLHYNTKNFVHRLTILPTRLPSTFILWYTLMAAVVPSLRFSFLALLMEGQVSGANGITDLLSSLSVRRSVNFCFKIDLIIVTKSHSPCFLFITQFISSVQINFSIPDSCSNKFVDVFHLHSKPQYPQCAIFREPKTEERMLVSRLVRRLVKQKKHIELQDIGKQIYERAVALIVSVL